MLIRTLVSAALTLTWMATAVPTAADCEPAGPLPEVLGTAEVAFVGSVVAVEGPVATFAVDEVWAGEVGHTEEVRGLFDELGGPNAGLGQGSGEDDRHWTLGTRYLVLPWVADGVLRDHICTATTEWTPELGQLRPADARILRSTEASDGAPAPILVALVVAGLVALASVLAFRRR